VSDYESRQQDGWPAQPPGGGAAQGEYGQGGYGQQPGYGPGPYDQQATQPTYAQQPGPPPRRRSRKRRLAWLAVAIAAFLLIFGVGDQIAKSYAQNRIASQIQSAGLDSKPAVNIEGWPFLTQIAVHKVNAIDISASNVTTKGGKLPVSFAAKATGVHLNSSFNGATVDHIDGQVTVTYKSLDSYLGDAIGIPELNGIQFSPDPQAGPNAVKADAGIASVTATVVKTGANQITIKFGSLGGIASVLGDAGSIPDQVIDIPKLPAGLVVGSPQVTSQGIVVPASASNTTLTQ
jgi:hypothetical protein